MPSRSRPSSELETQLLRRAVKAAGPAVVAEYKKCRTHQQKAAFRENWKRERTFDFITTGKEESEARTTTDRRKGTWMTEVQLLQAEGYTKLNPDKAALKHAKAIMAKCEKLGVRGVAMCKQRGCNIYRYCQDEDDSDFDKKQQIYTKGERKLDEGAQKRVQVDSSSSDSSSEDSSSEAPVPPQKLPAKAGKGKAKSMARSSSSASSLDNVLVRCQLVKFKMEQMISKMDEKPWLSSFKDRLEQGVALMNQTLQILIQPSVEREDEQSADQQSKEFENLYNSVMLVDGAALKAMGNNSTVKEAGNNTSK